MSSSIVASEVAFQAARNLSPVEPALLDVQAVARLLGCSARHVYRLSDGGRMPAPVRLGSLVRWKLDGPGGLREWLAAGCPSERRAGR